MVYASIYWLMAAITYGAFIPSGLFTPSLIFGGCIGCVCGQSHVQQHAHLPLLCS
jgi:chloride channel 7